LPLTILFGLAQPGTYVMKVYEGHWFLEEVSRDQNRVPRNYSKLEYLAVFWIQMDLHKNCCLDPDPQKNVDPDPAGRIWEYFYNILSQLANFFSRFLLFYSKK
jgi:hypothetical protein